MTPPLKNLPPVPRTEQYVKALKHLEKKINPLQRKLLVAHYHAPDHAATARELAQKVGAKDYRTVSLHYGKLGVKLREALKYDGYASRGGQQSYVIASFEEPGGTSATEWTWHMHGNLADALTRLGWVNDDHGKSTNAIDESVENIVSKTYLLTWNPNRWPWEGLDNSHALFKKQGYLDDRWSCGRTKRIRAGDRFFLLRQGVEPRGIMASGLVNSAPHADQHWDENRDRKALYVDIRFDALIVPDSEGVLPLSQLQNGALAEVNWSTQSSGISIGPLVSIELEKLWHDFLEGHGQSPVTIPEEVSSPMLYIEGASQTIKVNAYERDPRARKACIEHYGTNCFICDFDFGAIYGVLGHGFIHVHHVVPLSDIGKSYAVDPIVDLRPVCPNCHAMLHRRAEVLPVESLKKILHK